MGEERVSSGVVIESRLKIALFGGLLAQNELGARSAHSQASSHMVRRTRARSQPSAVQEKRKNARLKEDLRDFKMHLGQLAADEEFPVRKLARKSCSMLTMFLHLPS